MVSAAGSASEAFECLQTRRPDVLLCHIRMHGEDGCSPIRRVRLIEVGTSQDFVFSFLLDFFVSPCCARCLLTILEATSSSRPG